MEPNEALTPLQVTQEELEKINRYTRKKLTAEDVYTFRLLLCDNEIDRDMERFDTAALPKLAQLFLGKTGLFDHSMKTKDQTARIYDTDVETHESRKNQCGEAYSWILAKAYMPKTEKNADLIAEIEAGIKKETSVGCAVEKVTCSICGEDMKTGKCTHRRGKRYGGQLCHAVLREPTDAYEWSFVAVPAQREAGVTKAYVIDAQRRETEESVADIKKILQNTAQADTLGQKQTQKLLQYLSLAEGARETEKLYRAQLQTETVRLGGGFLPELDAQTMSGICDRLSIPQIKALREALFEGGRRTLPQTPLTPQLYRISSNPMQSDTANAEFKI